MNKSLKNCIANMDQITCMFIIYILKIIYSFVIHSLKCTFCMISTTYCKNIVHYLYKIIIPILFSTELFVTAFSISVAIL